MKRIYIFILLILTIIGLNCLNLHAETYTSDDGKSQFTISSSSNKELYGLNYNQMYCTSKTDTYSDGTQMINEFEMKTDGVNSKLVSWCIQSGMGGYTRSTLSTIAANYEEKHPGWIVVAGINGDQYFAYYGNKTYENGSFYYVPQPYYPLIIDGERRFAESITGNHKNSIGLKNNGQANSFAYSSDIEGLYLEILDEDGNVTNKHLINKINESACDNEISVWMGYVGMSEGLFHDIDVTTNKTLYISEAAELAYMSNSRDYDVGSKSDQLFARGTISKIDKSIKVEKWMFAVESDQLEEILHEGSRVRIQYYYTNNEMNNVESSFGYHSTQRYNNQDVDGLGSYDTTRYNRSVFGKKADGTYVLMTVARGNVNGGTYTGMSQHETNAVLKYYGVTEAYQQDGGGSVTAIIRNDMGTFDLVNESSDSSIKERSILMGCFFVVRDPEYRFYGKDATRSSITLTKVSRYNDEVISNVYAEVNKNKYYPSENGNILIDNLEDNTKYDVVLHYTINGISCETTIKCKTDSFTAPNSGVEILDIGGTHISIKTTDRYYKEFKELKASVYKVTSSGQEDLSLGEHIFTGFNEEWIFVNLVRKKNYNLIVEYKVFDDFKNEYVSATEEISFTTNEHNLPKISSFKVTNIDNKSISFSYSIFDEDELVDEIYILYHKVGEENNQIYFPEASDETTELLLNKDESYVFKMVVRYLNDKKLESEDIYIEYNPTMDKPEKANKKCGKKSAIILFGLVVLLNGFIIIKKK